MLGMPYRLPSYPSGAPGQAFKDVPHRDTILNGAIRSLLRPTDTALDAGCGSTLPFLELHGGSARFFVGIDVERPSEPVPPRTAVALANLTGLPFPAATFDLVISRSVVEHLADPAEVMREIARVLKPGGRFIFTTPNLVCSSLIAGAKCWLKDF